jgi:hypothetical protein
MRTQDALREGALDSLELLMQEHDAVIRALQEAGCSDDVTLCDLVQRIHQAIGEVTTVAAQERDAIGRALYNLGHKRRQLIAYMKAQDSV